MVSTFMGLETARRGMTAQQSALYTLGHNISNANTPGYTRQRVNFTQTTSFPSVGMNAPQIPGQMGTGVQAGSVQRIRDSFLDTQYRGESNKVGYYGMLSDSLSKMEGIMNEPSDSGLQSTMEKFWNSLQTLSSNPENSGARDVVAANGQMVADTINYYYNSLSSIQTDIGNQIDVKTNSINSIIDNIDQLNHQIASVEPNGYLPNDLYDQRDALVDQLSSMINIKVSSVKPANYGNAKPIAEGLYNIELINKEGKPYTPAVELIPVDPSGMKAVNRLTVNYQNTTDPKGAVKSIQFGTVEVTDMNFSGELAGAIESYGYVSGTEVKGTYPDMLSQLNKMTEAFANEFNKIHSEGYALGAASMSGKGFFTFSAGNAAKSISVSKDILDNPLNIAAGKNSGASGDNGNVQALADLKKVNFSDYTFYKVPANTLPDGLTGSFDSFYAGLIGKLGVNSQSAQKNASNSQVLADSVDKNRQSVSSVSLDEEMTDMIKFQQAYNASARNITIVDEMLDKIINGMGTGGR
ncbi:flagellar hook-associated protein FlgK [Bacillus sp. MUM 13]|uniref:flagellar hook-associated protein FlgK n=1 Tax=Bacillus sp. MUM 13 TaxID=1678001 RepID=UPI0008F5DF3C|nr:flagellar hook-associated protein FlgK [Bacillus sp. MUM 13]OIK11430.1 flagellar hook-associated protein FlgK [Bacillus sp. MUM 13]